MNPTQEMIKRLFLSFAISVAALIAGTSNAAAAVTRCQGPLPPGTYDTVLVPKGINCQVGVSPVGGGLVTVQGNVTLQEGASLTNDCNDFTVNGNLQGEGVNSVIIIGPTVRISGNVSITGATGHVFLDDVTIGGNLNISDSNGIDIILLNSVIAGNALVQDNTLTDFLRFIIGGNKIAGNLVCGDNAGTPGTGGEGMTNTVGGQKIGQCSAL